ncbi:hypothetical protein FHS15_000076 [Paenibacillus castaneae]|nr:hypothetical protein [Paenibacillus castaneae]
MPKVAMRRHIWANGVSIRCTTLQLMVTSRTSVKQIIATLSRRSTRTSVTRTVSSAKRARCLWKTRRRIGSPRVRARRWSGCGMTGGPGI